LAIHGIPIVAEAAVPARSERRVVVIIVFLRIFAGRTGQPLVFIIGSRKTASHVALG